MPAPLQRTPGDARPSRPRCSDIGGDCRRARCRPRSWSVPTRSPSSWTPSAGAARVLGGCKWPPRPRRSPPPRRQGRPPARGEGGDDRARDRDGRAVTRPRCRWPPNARLCRTGPLWVRRERSQPRQGHCPLQGGRAHLVRDLDRPADRLRVDCCRCSLLDDPADEDGELGAEVEHHHPVVWPAAPVGQKSGRGLSPFPRCWLSVSRDRLTTAVAGITGRQSWTR